MSPSPATRFFEHALPGLASAELHRLYGSRGSIAFKVGADGWTFRFASAEPVEHRFDRDADLHLWFTEPAFAQLVDGTLEVGAAARGGEVRARGELRLLELFGRLLQPEAAGLGWDVVP